MAAVVTFPIGPASIPERESPNTGQQDDLDASIPGTGIALGGDGKTDYPRITVPGVYEGRNPLTVPDGYRPLPTGTALGPNGEHYGLYSVVAYSSPGFTTPDTTIVDLADPGVAVGVLEGVSQGSAAYDPASTRMLVLGNDAVGRALWVSKPVKWLCWRTWWQTLGQPRYFTGRMQGLREAQIVALPGGGFLVVAAADNQPVVGIAASSAAGLLAATPSWLVGPDVFGGMFPYGPTVTELTETAGGVAVAMRVSTFGDGGYDPHTYLTRFVVQRN
jgi:hypothetical protein